MLRGFHNGPNTALDVVTSLTTVRDCKGFKSQLPRVIILESTCGDPRRRPVTRVEGAGGGQEESIEGRLRKAQVRETRLQLNGNEMNPVTEVQ